jgi:hypothetical protein
MALCIEDKEREDEVLKNETKINIGFDMIMFLNQI